MYFFLYFLFIFLVVFVFFFFKQKTAYEMRISDWSSDVCSSDLLQTTIPVLAISIGLKPGRRCSPPRIDRARPKFHLAVMPFASVQQIGRASCRERVCQYV